MTDYSEAKVVVVGAGAMGSLFGGLLTEGGLDVTLVDVWQAYVDAINANGLKMVGLTAATAQSRSERRRSRQRLTRQTPCSFSVKRSTMPMPQPV